LKGTTQTRLIAYYYRALPLTQIEPSLKAAFIQGGVYTKLLARQA
jgi:hypothetical protein